MTDHTPAYNRCQSLGSRCICAARGQRPCVSVQRMTELGIGAMDDQRRQALNRRGDVLPVKPLAPRGLFVWPIQFDDLAPHAEAAVRAYVGKAKALLRGHA